MITMDNQHSRRSAPIAAWLGRLGAPVLSTGLAMLACIGCQGGETAPLDGPAPAEGEPRPSESTALAEVGSRVNDIPPREQWLANFGYCGELSLISAGLYFGQYVSQYDARALASDLPQSEEDSQLLLGFNDATTASKMRLTATRKARMNVDPRGFLTWVKSNVLRGNPVVIAVYMNQRLFNDDRDPTAGDEWYDHIVPVTGVQSSHPLNDTAYHGDDVIFYNDLDVFTDDSDRPVHTFSSTFDAFLKTRRQANARSAPPYSLASAAPDFGIAITGVMDTNHETVRVRVDTDQSFEHPEIEEGSDERPAPMPLTLKVTVSGLTPGVSYRVYRYDDLDLVPRDHFNARAAQAVHARTISISSGESFVFTEDIMSNEMAIYRAVPASAQ